VAILLAVDAYDILRIDSRIDKLIIRLIFIAQYGNPE